MPRSMLLLALIALSACAGSRPAPPEMTRCQNLPVHFRCRGKDGKHYSDPYPGREPLECHPVADEEARRNFEDSLR